MVKYADAPKGAVLSDEYAFFVKTDNGWESVPVYMALIPNGDSHTEPLPKNVMREFPGIGYGPRLKKTYFVNISFSGKVNVRVLCKRTAENFALRPEKQAVPLTVTGKAVEFTLTKPCRLSLEPDGDMFGALRIFADEIKEYDASGYKNVIRFAPGYYTAYNCDLISKNEDGEPVIYITESDTAVILEAGAVVAAAIEVKSRAENVYIAGNGMLNLLNRAYGYEQGFETEPLYGGFRAHPQPAVYIHERCKNIILEDITLISNFRGVCVRNSYDLMIDGVKLITHCENADGMNFANVSNVEIKNCYVQSNDDSFAVFTACDSITTLWDAPEFVTDTNSRNFKVHDSIFWTAARAFMIGGHSTGKTEPHDLLENIEIYDCDVLDTVNRLYGTEKSRYHYWSGIFRVLSQTGGHTRNIRFKNIDVNWTKNLIYQPIHMAVRDSKNASYSEAAGYRIDDVTLEDIRFHNVPKDCPKTLFKTFDAGEISGITLKNITFDGKKMTADDYETEGENISVTVE